MPRNLLPFVLLVPLVIAHVAITSGDQPHATNVNYVSATITDQGRKLARFLDSMDVEHHWLRSHKHIAWRSGEPLDFLSGQTLPNYHKDETHCSAFVAAACERKSVYILRPPAHSHNLLANAQSDWLASESGRECGWLPVADAASAQSSANRGELVVAVYKNPDVTAPGHIAIVRPSEKAESLIQTEGPQIVQAGFTNANSTTLKIGFSHHPGAWRDGKNGADGTGAVEFFKHPLSLGQFSGNTAD